MDVGTRTWTKTLRAVVNGRLVELRTATPGRVEEYDPADQRATVLPLLVQRTRGGEEVRPKPIPNVPVLHPRAGGFAIHLPISSGDVGLLLCSDRSLDAWLESGGVVDPADPRRHRLVDAVFLPGLHHWGDPLGNAVDGDLTLGLESRSAEVRVTGGGKVKLGASTASHPAPRGDNLSAILNNVLNALLSAKPVGNLGAPVLFSSDPTLSATLTQALSDLATLNSPTVEVD